MMKVSIQLTHPDAKLPAFKTLGAAGADLYSIESGEVLPGQTALFPLGFKMAIPEGHEAQIRSRSGLAAKYSVCVANSPGTIDSDYRGEIGVILQNNSKHLYSVSKGERIAQMVVNEVPKVFFESVQSLDMTERGEGGFGSTGKK